MVTEQSKQIEQILTSKWTSNELPHFYIFQNKNYPQAQVDLKSWLENLILKFCKIDLPQIQDTFIQEIHKKGHPDILWIQADSGHGQYSHTDPRFQEILTQSDFRPLELKRKIVVIENAYLISETLANKLLKTLEDSQDYMLFLFLNPGHKKLLDTMTSRSIALSIHTRTGKKSMKEASEGNFNQWLNSYPISEIQNNEQWQMLCTALSDFEQGKIGLNECINQLKALKQEEYLLFQVLVDWMTREQRNYQKTTDAIEAIKWWEEQKTFHNSAFARLENLLRTTFAHRFN